MESIETMSTSRLNSKEHISSIEYYLNEISRGEISYMSDLYQLTSSAIYGYALSMLKNEDEAKDVLQDCYLVIHRSANQYVPKGKPMAWIITITRNLCLQKIKELSRSSNLQIEEVEYGFIQENEDMSWLYQCLNRLNQQEREIVMLHAMSGLKHREIAKILKLPLSTVLSKYHRALKKLKEEIRKENGNE